MQTFSQWFFFTFGLRRRTSVRRTPAALQVDRLNGLPAPAKRSAQRRAPFRVGIEIRGQGEQYIKPLAAQPRST